MITLQVERLPKPTNNASARTDYAAIRMASKTNTQGEPTTGLRFKYDGVRNQHLKRTNERITLQLGLRPKTHT